MSKNRGSVFIKINPSVTVVLQGTTVEVRQAHGPTFTCGWPEGLPRNYDELVRVSGGFIAKRIAWHNKVGRNYEDLSQDVWLRLVGAQVLERFVAGAAALRWPDRLTVAQAIAFLGLTPQQWACAVAPCPDKWTPQAIDGGDLSDPATEIRLEQVRLLDEALSMLSRPNVRRRPDPTLHGWQSYLGTAIYNNFSNFCRTQNRRYQEHLLSQHNFVATRGDHSVLVTRKDTYESWEDCVEAPNSGDEDRLIGLIAAKHELAFGFRTRGLPPEQLLATEAYVSADGRVRQRATPEARVGLEVLDRILEGDSHPKGAQRVSSYAQSQIRAGFRAQARARNRRLSP